MKHTIKRIASWTVSRTCHVLGLRSLFRGRRSGIPVLMFHNVGHPPETAYLPAHMKVSERKLETILKLLRRAGCRTGTVGEIGELLERGEVPQDLIGLTFDDGYRDNHDRLLPILNRFGARATVYVQTGPMKGRLGWLHHYFWVLHRVGPHRLAALLAEQLDRPHLKDDLARLPADAERAEYEMKRLLKYEVAPDDRDRILARIFAEQGGDDTELARAVYLSPEQCRALDEAGLEIGAHTVNHVILSSLEPTRQRREIEGSLRDLETWLGHGVSSFAYPYGRAWDYDAGTLEILAELGFRTATTAMPGLNDSETPRLELRRIAVSGRTSLAELMCEVDGVYDWFAVRGVDLRV